MTGRELTRETVVTLDGLGGKGVCAIQCHQALLPEAPETVEQVVLCKALKDWIEMARGDRIEEGTEVIVAGDLRDAKEGVDVIVALVFLEPALILQTRGRLGKADAKGASGSIGHTVLCIAACTTIGQVSDPLLENGPEIVKA